MIWIMFEMLGIVYLVELAMVYIRPPFLKHPHMHVDGGLIMSTEFRFGIDNVPVQYDVIVLQLHMRVKASTNCDVIP